MTVKKVLAVKSAMLKKNGFQSLLLLAKRKRIAKSSIQDLETIVLETVRNRIL